MRWDFLVTFVFCVLFDNIFISGQSLLDIFDVSLHNGRNRGQGNGKPDIDTRQSGRESKNKVSQVRMLTSTSDEDDEESNHSGNDLRRLDLGILGIGLDFRVPPGLGHRPHSSENGGQNTHGVRKNPCKRRSRVCSQENYLEELGIHWSRRHHNGSGFYVLDDSAHKKYYSIGYQQPNKKYGSCRTPMNEKGYCRHLEHCVLNAFRRDFTKFLQYTCNIQTGEIIGVCCPKQYGKEDEIDTEVRMDHTTPHNPPEMSSRSTARPQTTQDPNNNRGGLFPGIHIPGIPDFNPFNFNPFPQPTRPPKTTKRPTPPPPPPMTRRPTTTEEPEPETSIPTTEFPKSHPKPPHSKRKCGISEKKTSRIIGGRISDPKAWPWMAALLRSDSTDDSRAGQYCGGVLISEFHILTASHCVDGFEAKDVKIRLGEYDFSKTNDSKPFDFEVSSITMHENYNRYSYQNDIALIKISKSAFYNPTITNICLPPDDERTFENQVGIVTGWGTIYYGGPTSDALMEVSVPIWRQDDCVAAYTQPIEETNLCAGVRSGSRDSCQGDSGGPLQLEVSNRWTTVGVVSWGIRCAEPGYPGVYTRVSKYLDWISSHM